VFRKGALKLVTLGDKRDDLPIVVSKDTLSEYVGQPIFQNERLYETTPPGVVMGLAWTSMGEYMGEGGRLCLP
jgi:ATP-dependent Lon protease